MGDLPDWTQATSNAGTLLESGQILAGNTFALDVSNNNSLVITASGLVANTEIVLTAEWFTDSTMTKAITNQTFTAVPNAIGNSFVGVETPVYAGYLTIINNSGQTVTLNIIGASRTVVAARVLNDTAPSRRFAVSANMVSGTQYILTRTDTGPSGYNSNAQATLTAQSNTAGNLYVRFVGWSFAISLTPVLAIVAAGFSQTTIALPQGVVDFVFIPTANNATGSITLDIAPGQL